MDLELVKILIAAGAAVACTIGFIWVTLHVFRVLIPKLQNDAAADRKASIDQQNADRDKFLTQLASDRDKFSGTLAAQLNAFREDLRLEREARLELAATVLKVAESCRGHNPDGRPHR